MKEIKPDFQHPQQQSSQPAVGQVYSSVPDIASLAAQQAQMQTQLSSFQQKRINFNTDIIGLFETVSVVPTNIPTAPYEQIKVYVNGATLRLYWYDSVAHLWHYVTATA